LVVGVVLVILFFVFIVPFTGFHYVTGNGSHVGYVTAVEKTGLVFKTYRAYVKTNVESSQEDSYCVIDDAVAAQLASASELGVKVKVGYFSWLAAGVSNCGGEGDIISSVVAI
jgi:hypothetical protein